MSLTVFFDLKFTSLSSIKVGLCIICKDENLYIKEFIEHYKNIGYNHIFIYDNNDINGERLEDIIQKEIDEGFISIINYRGDKKRPIFRAYIDCYEKNNKNYNWLSFFDIDEFLEIKPKGIKIQRFLSNERYKYCQNIKFNWLIYSDNDKLYYENKSLIERFPDIVPLKQSQISVKSIVRGHLNSLTITWMHWINPKFKGCNGFGGPTDLEYGNDFLFYVIDHYYSKSTEEFINKINRGDVWRNTFDYIKHRTEKYLNQNHVTLEKIEMLERGIKINLSRYKERLKKNIVRNRNRN